MTSPFIKQLTSSDPKLRDDALTSLRQYVSASRVFTHEQFLQIWKGLYFCFWHSDTVPVQQLLANDLAGLVASVKRVNLITFLDAFWVTMSREWLGIDIHRLDKFYSLLRKFIFAAFQRLYTNKWDPLDEYIDLLGRLPLATKDRAQPDGIRYHVADIYLEELEKVVPEDARKDCPIEKLLEPFANIVKDCPTKSVRLRVMKTVFDNPVLKEFGYDLGESEDDNEESEEEFAGFD